MTWITGAQTSMCTYWREVTWATGTHLHRVTRATVGATPPLLEDVEQNPYIAKKYVRTSITPDLRHTNVHVHVHQSI